MALCTQFSFANRHQLVRYFYIASKMARSRFEYVKSFEVEDRCLMNTWIVVRIDGKNFHRFADVHGFTKPNDLRSLNLMSRSAEQVMLEFKDIDLAYGQSDEYSFVFKRTTDVYNRRASKLMTNIVSLFTSSFCYFWSNYFTDVAMQYPPSFDGRVVLYPSEKNLKDYLSWRQADCHINNLYNTVFWALVQHGGLTNAEAQQKLKGTTSGQKNEIMFTDFGINYDKQPEIYKKGTILLRTANVASLQTTADISSVNADNLTSSLQVPTDIPKYAAATLSITTQHTDLIRNTFWENHSYMLS